MSDDFAYASPADETDPDDAAIVGWLRWWHWLVLIALLLAVLLYYPLWRFEQNWNRLQVGDSFDRVQQLLGDPGKASYRMQAAGTNAIDEAYVYNRYWRTYEVLVSEHSRRVTAKNVIASSSTSILTKSATAK